MRMGSVGGERSHPVIREEFMRKRSQMKSRLKIDNYKERWFVLTHSELTYHTGTPSTGPKKMKGSVDLTNVRAVELVNEEDIKCAFQIEYHDPDSYQVIRLYIAAHNPQQRDNWIRLLRQECQSCGAPLDEMYHPGVWLFKGEHFSCCHQISKTAPGCQYTFSSQSAPALPQRVSGGTDEPLLDPSQHSPPSSKKFNGNLYLKHDQTPSRQPTKYVAKYSWDIKQHGDIPLERGDVYTIVNDSCADWWKVRNKNGEVGCVPSNYLQEIDKQGLWQFVWFCPGMSRGEAACLLKQTAKEGCFVVRPSQDGNKYSVALYCLEDGRGQVKHYHIQQDRNTSFYYFAPRHSFPDIPQLINYHKHNCGGLATRLKCCPNSIEPDNMNTAKFEIDPSELQVMHELGKGEFGKVYYGQWKNFKVAVKMMKEGAMSEEAFIEEARTMMNLHHTHLVQLYGVCIKTKPLKIVTEYMKNGSLLQYLRSNKESLRSRPTSMLDICLQVCNGMAYLESKSFIHRDLAARNCLVNDRYVVKVADFGLARYVLDDEYTSSQGTKFPIRWTSPEVLERMRFSSKSDVWAFGVLMWEVYSGGLTPYSGLEHSQVITMLIDEKRRLSCPEDCPHEVFQHMRACWHEKTEIRPSFKDLQDTLSMLKEPVMTI